MNSLQAPGNHTLLYFGNRAPWKNRQWLPWCVNATIKLGFLRQSPTGRQSIPMTSSSRAYIIRVGTEILERRSMQLLLRRYSEIDVLIISFWG